VAFFAVVASAAYIMINEMIDIKDKTKYKKINNTFCKVPHKGIYVKECPFLVYSFDNLSKTPPNCMIDLLIHQTPK
jgi:hypothetical protein